MWPYNDTENSWLRDSSAPSRSTNDKSWPTLQEIEYHRRNAEIIRSQAFGNAARHAIAFICKAGRKMRRLPAKLRAPIGKPGATA